MQPQIVQLRFCFDTVIFRECPVCRTVFPWQKQKFAQVCRCIEMCKCMPCIILFLRTVTVFLCSLSGQSCGQWELLIYTCYGFLGWGVSLVASKGPSSGSCWLHLLRDEMWCAECFTSLVAYLMFCCIMCTNTKQVMPDLLYWFKHSC